MKVVNLFAGPGAGKSTMAADVFAMLKRAKVNVELVTEFAKDLTWEERWGAFSCQPYVFGEQVMRLHRLIPQVELVVTDSPILLSRIYGKNTKSWAKAVEEVFATFDNLNFFIDRDKPYQQLGRSQNAEQAKQVDERVFDMLYASQIQFEVVKGNLLGAIYVKNAALVAAGKVIT